MKDPFHANGSFLYEKTGLGNDKKKRKDNEIMFVENQKALSKKFTKTLQRLKTNSINLEYD